MIVFDKKEDVQRFLEENYDGFSGKARDDIALFLQNRRNFTFEKLQKLLLLINYNLIIIVAGDDYSKTEDLGQLVVEEKKRRKMTFRKLAEEVNLPKTSLETINKRHGKALNYNTAEKLVEFLDGFIVVEEKK